MSIIVEISVPAEDFALGCSRQGIDSPTYELERSIPSTDSVMPFFWAHDTDPDDLGTSDQAANERMRRGTAKLVRSTLIADRKGGGSENGGCR